MIGYSEVIQTMAAMIIFSMILLSANSMIHRNSMLQIGGELEQEVISLGQEIIEEARSKSFDQITVNAAAPPAIIPGGFTAAGNLGSDAGEANRAAFNDFDDYNGWSSTMTTTHGDFEVSVEVFYVDDVNFQKISTQSTFKKIEVTVESAFLRSGDDPTQYVLEFIRNYYAD
jgi:Tfp pilus assembly protein PilV